MKKISSESEAVPSVSQNFVFFEQNFGCFFTEEIYIKFFQRNITHRRRKNLMLKRSVSDCKHKFWIFY